jgi:S-adenosylmethionine hydrolase
MLRPVYLFTDFGWSGPYVGQMTAAILAVERRLQVVDLMHDAPAVRPELAAYLLPRCCEPLPPDAVVVAVVDPGVGGPRLPLVVELASGMLFVGPDNGLLSRLPGIRQVARIDWRPLQLSTSFHGRDLFAPVAARLASGGDVATSALAAESLKGADWPEQAARVVFVDAFGNLMTGLLADRVAPAALLAAGGCDIPHARTFFDAPPAVPFWYRNALGLVEIAVNGASAAEQLSLRLGDAVQVP